MPASLWVADRIVHALESIQARHGVGEITGVDFATGRVRLFAPDLGVWWSPFRIDGGKVHFRGRRRSY